MRALWLHHARAHQGPSSEMKNHEELWLCKKFILYNAQETFRRIATREHCCRDVVVEAARSPHPAFFEHLESLQDLTEFYKDILPLVVRNPDNAVLKKILCSTPEWSDYVQRAFDCLLTNVVTSEARACIHCVMASDELSHFLLTHRNLQITPEMEAHLRTCHGADWVNPFMQKVKARDLMLTLTDKLNAPKLMDNAFDAAQGYQPASGDQASGGARVGHGLNSSLSSPRIKI